ncbi:MAG: leucine-rich repeat protein [Ruminococcus sp.]|nr:leucine-rich repeat protein [Ruminococcus sp.]
MKHLKRKLTAAILSVLLATSSFTAAPISVTAATSEETEIQETATPEKEQEEAVGDSESPELFTSGDYQYSIDPDDGTAVIENYMGDEPELTIPSSIDGHQVKKIGFYAFLDYGRDIKKITIPYGVTEIGVGAFTCYGLNEVTIPDSVVLIDTYAFNGTPLEKIKIPKSVETIGEQAFWKCSNLESVTIGTGNGANQYGTTIGKDAFGYCENLTSLSLGENVVHISEGAFRYCSNLKSVTIPNSTKVIDTYAFIYCTNLEHIKIGNGLSRLGKDFFMGCTNIKSIEVDKGNEYFFNANGSFYGNEGMLFGNGDIEYDENGKAIKVYNDSDLIWYDWSSEEKDVVIPEGVKQIKDYAFEGAFNVNSVRANKDLKYLGLSAFFRDKDNLGNYGIKTVYLYDSLESCYILSVGNMDIYYYGTEKQWNKVKGTKDLDYYSITMHFLDSEPIHGNLYESEEVDGIIKTKAIDGIETEFKESWFEDNSYYNHDLARLCSEMVVMGDHAESDKKVIDLEKSLSDLGFSNFEHDNDTLRDEVNYFIASRQIKKAGKNYNLVFCGCIGSNGKQWNSDFDPKGRDSSSMWWMNPDEGTVENHRGFNDAKNYIRRAIQIYYFNHDFDKDDTILLLTGHSRGAATVNLLAAEIIDDDWFVTPDNLYTYTFATPKCTHNRNRFDEKYRNIYNIVFPTDFVTKVLPYHWGYGRYGTTYSLPTKTNDSNYSSFVDIQSHIEVTGEYVRYEHTYGGKMLEYYGRLNGGSKEFADYDDGEKTVWEIVDKITSNVHSVNYYYNQKTYVLGKHISLYDFFRIVVCPFVNGVNEDQEKALVYAGITEGTYYWDIVYFFLNNAFKTNNPIVNKIGSKLDFKPRFHCAHYPETYCAFMLALDSNEVTTYRKGYNGSVNCPVDIEITEKESGEVVGRIVNNTVDEEIAAKPNSVVMTVDGDEKEFWLPGNGEYDVRLIGNDNGVMDYTVREIDPDTGETNRVNYYDVPVEKDKAYTDFFTSEKAFVITAENGSELTPDETFTSENEVTYSVTVTAEGSGTASDSLTVTSGDYVTLTASPVESEFLGWYQNDTLVSTDLEYRFRPTEDISLTAKFTGEDLKPVEFGDVDVDGEVTISDATQIQMYLAELVELEDVQVLLSDYNLDGSVDISDATQIQLKLAELI